MSGLELRLETVVNLEAHKPWSTSNLMLAISCARYLYTLNGAIIGKLEASDIENNLIRKSYETAFNE